MNTIFKEGDHYKTITVFGRTFELRYGYYSEKDRHSILNEAIPIYPDFIKEPVHTDEGHPFVTQMQDVCEHYTGEPGGDDCFSCSHYLHGDELLGICVCEKNKMEKTG